MSANKCPLCGDAINPNPSLPPVRGCGKELRIRQLLREDIQRTWDKDKALDQHMVREHGFMRVHLDDASERVAHAYYRVVNEPHTVKGITYKFGDYVEFKKGKVALYVPGGIYRDRHVLALTRKSSGRIVVNES